MNQSNTDLVRGGYEAFGRGDMDAVMQFLQDTEWVEAEGAPWGGTYSGSEAILNGVFGPIMQDVQDFKATPREILALDGDRVLGIGSYTGQGSGGALNARFAHVWTVRDGKATHFEQFADTALLQQAVSE
jgi:uncharacterized protein